MTQDIVDYHTWAPDVDTPANVRDAHNIGPLFLNQVECLRCGGVARSRNRHDLRYCSCGAVAVDGGSWYQGIIGNKKHWKNAAVKYTDAT